MSNALVVDDDLDAQLLARMMLRQHGYHVSTAGSLGDLARSPSLLSTDLLLLDFSLGEFTGLDILDYLYDLRLNVAILLISSCSHATAEHVIEVGRSKGLRMLGFLPKADLISGLTPFLKPLETSLKAPTSIELATAIREKQLFLAFQPKQALATGAIVGVEALVRWRHPERGVLYPDSFIPLAEHSELIVPLTWYVLKLAFEQQITWRNRGWRLGIAVNVPALFINSDGMVETLVTLSQQYGADLTLITLELTESLNIECFGYARHVLSALRHHGCQLALDDFGTGYSSLVQLYRLPFNIVKIDRSFVSLIDEDRVAREIAFSIIDLGKRLELVVTAEGIENATQLALLANAGCQLGQGYHIARPIDADKIDQWLDDHSPCQ